MNTNKLIPFPFFIHPTTYVFLLLIGAQILLTTCIHEQAKAEQLVRLSADEQFEFADSLLKERDYAAAGTEFKKFVFFFPEDKRVEQANFKIGLSLFYQKKYEAALDQFNSILDRYGPTPTGIRSGLFMGRCHTGLNDFDSATHVLQGLTEKTKDEDDLIEIYYQLAWLYMESGDFKNAHIYFEKIQSMNQSRYPVESIVEEMNDYQTLSFKHPALAGIFSIIPGGGYAYCNRYQDALVSFLINGACAAAAWESFDKDLNILGGLLTVVGIGFYGGNIYGGISSAHKYNQSQLSEFMNNLKNQFNVDLMTGMGSDGIFLKIQRRF